MAALQKKLPNVGPTENYDFWLTIFDRMPLSWFRNPLVQTAIAKLASESDLEDYITFLGRNYRGPSPDRERMHAFLTLVKPYILAKPHQRLDMLSTIRSYYTKPVMYDFLVDLLQGLPNGLDGETIKTMVVRRISQTAADGQKALKHLIPNLLKLNADVAALDMVWGHIAVFGLAFRNLLRDLLPRLERRFSTQTATIPDQAHKLVMIFNLMNGEKWFDSERDKYLLLTGVLQALEHEPAASLEQYRKLPRDMRTVDSIYRVASDAVAKRLWEVLDAAPGGWDALYFPGSSPLAVYQLLVDASTITAATNSKAGSGPAGPSGPAVPRILAQLPLEVRMRYTFLYNGYKCATRESSADEYLERVVKLSLPDHVLRKDRSGAEAVPPVSPDVEAALQKMKASAQNGGGGGGGGVGNNDERASAPFMGGWRSHE